jgi:hypothetical protein
MGLWAISAISPAWFISAWNWSSFAPSWTTRSLDIQICFLKVGVKLSPHCSLCSAAKLRNQKKRALENDRFETFPDPVDNWMVWDLDEDDLAEVGTRRLHALTEVSARAFCSLLNKLFPKAA